MALNAALLDGALGIERLRDGLATLPPLPEPAKTGLLGWYDRGKAPPLQADLGG